MNKHVIEISFNAFRIFCKGEIVNRCVLNNPITNCSIENCQVWNEYWNNCKYEKNQKCWWDGCKEKPINFVYNLIEKHSIKNPGFLMLEPIGDAKPSCMEHSKIEYLKI